MLIPLLSRRSRTIVGGGKINNCQGLLIPTRCCEKRVQSLLNLRSISTSHSTDPTIIATTEKQRLATIRLYRILQRTCRSFPTQTMGVDAPTVLLQPELNAKHWGRHVVFKPPSSTSVEELLRLFYVLNDGEDDGVEIRKAPSIDDWYYNVVGRYRIEAELPPMTSLTCWTSTGQIQQAIRTAFRASFDARHDQISDLHFWAIRAVQFMHEQRVLWKYSSVATTNGVRVTATSRYGICSDSSMPVLCCLLVFLIRPPFLSMSRFIGSTAPTAVTAISPVGTSLLGTKFRFAYRIRIENVSSETVQLLGRSWCIEELTPDGKIDETKEKILVDSPATGAVGQLPVLRPGQVFEYMSGTDLLGEHGTMKGHFYMVRVPDDRNPGKAGDHVEGLSAGNKFEVEVATFPLGRG